MAYVLEKRCENCDHPFLAGSNHQKYCKDCRPIIREKKNKLWQHNHYMKIATEKNEKSRAYNKSEKGRAAQQLRDAVRQGKIQRQPCEVCGEPNAQGHHDNYDEPLKVIWLCAKHHREEHLFEPWQNELRRSGYSSGFLLGELIEACGSYFALWKSSFDGQWHSSFSRSGTGYEDTFIDNDYHCPKASGATPEEAVARLWLALHTKH